jgi:ribosomal protein S18 acetylase RimI-like enzyme
MHQRPRDVIAVRAATAADMTDVARMQLAAWHAAYRRLLADDFLDSLTVEGIAGYHGRHFDAAQNPSLDRSAFLVAEMTVPPAEGKKRPTKTIVGMVRGGPTREKTAAGDPVPPEVPRKYAMELFAIHVEPTAQRKGVGRQLFGAFVDAARKKMPDAALVLWVLKDNGNARGFYRKLGGSVVGECELTLGGKKYPQVAYGWPKYPNITQT